MKLTAPSSLASFISEKTSKSPEIKTHFREYILFMKESLRFYELHQYFNLVGSFAERYDIAI